MNEKYDEKQGEPVLAAEGLIRNYTKTGEQKGKDQGVKGPEFPGGPPGVCRNHGAFRLRKDDAP